MKIENTTDMTISADALGELMEKGGPVTVLDVRPHDQRQEWYIPASIHVDVYDALSRNDPDALSGVELPDDQLIVTVCGAGRTSLTAAKQLRARGIDARSLEGGMTAWSLAANIASVPLTSTEAQVVQVRRTGKGCLSYMVGADGEAAVIDASVSPDVYVREAEKLGWRIAHVLDTHIHADHLSRSRPLADMTGAALYLPKQDRVSFNIRPLRDHDVLDIGSARLQAIRTPGHTGESMSYLLDEAALFTGDTLFTDGVGRPDLEASFDEARTRAAALYDSLQRLLERVAPEAIVLPGHTSRPVAFDGRAIGEPMAAVVKKVRTLSLPKETFVERLLDRIPATPPNFERIVALNEAGASAPDDILELEAGGNRCAIS